MGLVKTNTYSKEDVERFGMEECMMPLTLAEVGEENIIRKIGGKQEVKAHLENLGFVVGGVVTIVRSEERRVG